MSHKFDVELEIPGFTWEEVTEYIYSSNHWREIRPIIRYCKRNGLQYKIYRRKK